MQRGLRPRGVPRPGPPGRGGHPLPAGVDKHRLWSTWRTLLFARAIENLAAVATTQNLFGPGERGMALLALPEEVVFETTRPGLFVLDVDLARVRDLRAQEDGIASQRTNAAKAGLLTQWQRPELYRTVWAPRAVRPL